MNEENQSFAGQAAAFQKIWADSLAAMAQSAMACTPESAPQETIRQIRSGIFEALAHSWEQFLRSPEFLQGMKQWMDQSMKFRQMSHDFMAKARQEFQEPSRSDLDGVLVAVRSLENRILQQVEELSSQVEDLRRRLDPDAPPAPSPKASSTPSKRPTLKSKRRRP